MTRIGRFFREHRAVSAMEYAILVGIIAVAIGLAMVTFSGDLTTAIEGIGDDIAATTSTTPVATP